MTTSPPPIDRDALRKLAEAATPGERTANGMSVENEYGGGRNVRGHEWDGFTAVLEDGHMEDDPAFLAATDPGTIIALLDALTRAEAQSEARRINAEYWKEIALQERGAALDALDTIKDRDAKIQAVRELHNPEESLASPACPEGCCGWCKGCGMPTPCDTIRALGGGS